jgi:hypothetical protein
MAGSETWSQYQTDLANAGFTNVQRQVLPSDTADLDQPADAVTLVSPARQCGASTLQESGGLARPMLVARTGCQQARA